MESLPEYIKQYAEIVHSTLNEGPNAVLSPANSAIVADFYKNMFGYTDPITGKFISSKSTLIHELNNECGPEPISLQKKKRKTNIVRLKFLRIVNTYHDRVFYRQ